MSWNPTCASQPCKSAEKSGRWSVLLTLACHAGGALLKGRDVKCDQTRLRASPDQLLARGVLGS
jgi:hypothetical protein